MNNRNNPYYLRIIVWLCQIYFSSLFLVEEIGASLYNRGMEVCELFRSIQGEGWRQGMLACFIRLARCNLRCSFCDTRYAWKKGKEMDVEELGEELGAFSVPYAVITGGEPMLQDLTPLIRQLHIRGMEVAIETNGTLWQDCKVDWLTVSPKQEALELFPHGYDERFLSVANEFKYIISSKKDISFIDTRISAPVILQPVNNDLVVANLILAFLEEERRKNWFLRMRLHTLLGIQ